MTAEMLAAGEPDIRVDIIAEAARQLAADDPEAALTTLRRASAGEAKSPRFHLVMGLVAWRLAEIERAIAIMLQCHEQAPMNGTIAEALASMFAQVGNLNESLYYGKLAIALGAAEGFADLLPPCFPNFDAAFLAIQERPLFVRAKFLIGSGNLIDGIDLVRQHVGLYPADEEARLLLGETLLRANRAAAAVDAMQAVARQPAASPKALSILARALAAVGEHERSRIHHQAACAAAPDDPAIGAARVADAFWSMPEAGPVEAEVDDWATRFGRHRKAAAWARPEQKLVVGYLLSGLADPRDAAAIAGVAFAHDRTRVSVVGYGVGAQAWAENAALSGSFDRWRDISGLDPATLARVLASDGPQVFVDCAGFAAPDQMIALARINTAIRVSWLGVPAGTGAPFYDASLGASAPSIPCWGAQYPLVRDWTRTIMRSSADVVSFGADATLRQLDARTVRLWSSVLACQPQAKLVLRANDMGPGGNIDRLVAHFGRDLAARIDIVDAAAVEDFYQRVDVALAPLKGSSPRMAAEALACGVPVVALAGTKPSEPYGAFLRARGLGGSLVGADERDYVAIAAGLGSSCETRARVMAEIRIVADGAADSARTLAGVIEAETIAALVQGAPR